MAIDKPSGMLSVPGKGPDKADCAAARVAAVFPNARGPLVIHRLDMETSGILLFALDEDAQRDLSRQFERRRVEKGYSALLPDHEGSQSFADSGEISLPMRADILNRPIQIVDHEQGREAVTRYRVIAREPGRMRLRFEPLTGRTHQLRLHAAAALRPIIGDTLYGGEEAERLMLHATALSFLEPGTDRRVDLSCDPPF